MFCLYVYLFSGYVSVFLKHSSLLPDLFSCVVLISHFFFVLMQMRVVSDVRDVRREWRTKNVRHYVE